MILQNNMIGNPETILVYGASGIGKTFQIEKCVQFLREHFGWKPGDPPFARVISWDSTIGPYKPYALEGSVDLLPANVIRDGDGEVPVLQVMTAIRRGMWLMPLPDGTSAWVGRKGSIPKFPQLSGLPADNGIRAIFVEGISELGDQLLQEHGNKARGLKADGKASQAGRFTQEVLSFSDTIKGIENLPINSASPILSHYGDVQDNILIELLKTGILSFPVDVVICSMHESKGVDEVSGTPAIGPRLPGRKAVTNTMPKFGHCFHLDLVEDPKTKATTRHAFFEKHVTPNSFNMRWQAKLSLSPSQLIAWKNRYPGDSIPLSLTGIKGSIAEFLQFILPKENNIGTRV